MKTSELIGDALDFAAGMTAGLVYELHGIVRYSSDWALGGPIVEREKISLEFMRGAGDAGLDVWVATRDEAPAFSEESGPTPLIAAMRCYVASQRGDEVDEIPEELK